MKVKNDHRSKFSIAPVSRRSRVQIPLKLLLLRLRLGLGLGLGLDLRLRLDLRLHPLLRLRLRLLLRLRLRLHSVSISVCVSTSVSVFYISQNFIIARSAAFERNKLRQILKIASISPKRLTYSILSFSFKSLPRFIADFKFR